MPLIELTHEDEYYEGSDQSPFLDEEEGRLVFTDALSGSTEEDDSHSFDSEEFQCEEKEAITVELSTRRNKYYALVGVVLLLVAAIVVIPVAVVTSKKKKNNKSTQDNGTVADPTPEEPVVTEVPVPNLVDGSSTGATSAPESTEPPADGNVQAPGDPFQEEEEEEQGASTSTAVAPGVATTAPTLASSISRGDSSPLEAITIPEPQPSSLQGFSSEVLEPYTSQAALEQDVALAANDMVQSILRQNLQMIQEYQAMGDMFTKDGTDQKTKSRTNNREADVLEGDTVQEDGSYVYAAYGDHLVVWNRLDGTMVAQEQMPTSTADEYGWINTPWISTVQISDHHVFVFASGYGHYDYGYNDGKDPSITLGDNETKLQVYTKPTPEAPILTLVGTQSLNGMLIKSMYMSETGTFHAVTGVDVNTGGFLGDPLTFWNFFQMGVHVNATEYVERAEKLAKDTLIPNFVSKLTQELMENNQGELPTILKANNWQTAQEQDRRRKLSSYMMSYGNDEGIRSYVQVLTIKPKDLPVDTFEVNSLKMNSTVVLGPHAYPTVHASGDNIVLTMDRFDFDTASQTRLFLLQLKVDAEQGSTFFAAQTSLPGSLAHRYAMDIQGDDLRVATTHIAFFPFDTIYAVCGHPPGMMTIVGLAEDKCTTQEGWLRCHDIVMEGCTNVTKTECPYKYECADEGDAGSSSENNVIVFSLSSEAGVMPEKGRVRIGNDHDFIQSIHFGATFSYAITSHYGREGPFYVLNMDEPSVTYTLQPYGMEGGVPSTYLQPINEESTLLVGIGQNSTGNSIFESNSGVTVTVFDVTDPNAPVVLASQMVNGDVSLNSPLSLAEYDAKAVQYTDNGLLIIPVSMYPSFKDIYTPHYTANGTDTYQLPPPMPTEIPLGFEGFVVLDLSDVQAKGIKEVFRINHLSSDKCNSCSTTGFLPNHRSIWYEDNNSLMTMYSHRVFSTDLDALTANWGLNVTAGGADDNCCF